MSLSYDVTLYGIKDGKKSKKRLHFVLPSYFREFMDNIDSIGQREIKLKGEGILPGFDKQTVRTYTFQSMRDEVEKQEKLVEEQEEKIRELKDNKYLVANREMYKEIQEEINTNTGYLDEIKEDLEFMRMICNGFQFAADYLLNIFLTSDIYFDVFEC